MSEPRLDGAFRRILNRQQGSPLSPCPDANMFAAWLDGRLPAREAERFEDHASLCPQCREAVALSLRMQVPEPAPPAKEESPRGFVYRSSALRLVFAAVVVVIVGVLLFQSTRYSAVVKKEPEAARGAMPAGVSGGADAALSPAGGRRDAVMAARSGSRETAGASGTLEPKRAETAPSMAAGHAEPGLQKGAANAVQTPRAAAEAKPEQAAAATAPPATAPGQPVSTQAANIAQGQNVQNQAQNQAGQAARPAPVTQQTTAGEVQQPRQAQVATQAAAANLLEKSMGLLQLPRVRQALAEARSLITKDPKEGNAKKIGAHVFYRTGNYWVDAESVAHSDSPAREIARDSVEYKEILAKEKDLAGLQDVPILLFWNQTNILIR